MRNLVRSWALSAHERKFRVNVLAAVATFLASGASSFVNGVEWFVDGGQAQV